MAEVSKSVDLVSKSVDLHCIEQELRQSLPSQAVVVDVDNQ